jgi:hypothetical protein
MPDHQGGLQVEYTLACARLHPCGAHFKIALSIRMNGFSRKLTLVSFTKIYGAMPILVEIGQ